jgi:hypothetical protein
MGMEVSLMGNVNDSKNRGQASEHKKNVPLM